MRKSGILLLLLVLLLTSAIRGWGEPPASEGAPIFTSPEKASRSPALIAVPGLVFVVWEEEMELGNTDIFFSYSVDEEHFTEPKAVASTSGTSQEPALVFRDGFIYVAWSESIAGNKEIWLATQTNLDQPFQEPQNISQNSGESKQPTLAISNTGLFIAWADNTKDPKANPEGDFEILLRISQDGRTFMSPVNVSYTKEPSLAPALASNGDNLFVTWEEGTGAKEILFRQSTLFSFPLNISCSPFQASERPAIAASSAMSEVSIVWEEAVEGKMEIFFSKATDVGIPFSTPTFSTPNNLSHTPGSDSRFPAIAVDSQGNTFITWQETLRDPSTGRFDTDILLLTSLAPFISPINVSNSPTRASSSPAIATDGLNLYVVWEEEISPGKPDIYFRRLPLFPRG
jgi:hypothetical protein